MLAKTRQLQNPSSSSPSTAAALLAFKPRQVLLLQQSSKSHPAVMEKKQQSSLLIQQSILHYLHLHGFSKTLKRFLQETQTEGDSWKSCSHNLEDIYGKYLKNCADNDANSKGYSELEQCEDGTNGKNTNSTSAGSEETISKKKKKKKTEDKNDDVPDVSLPETVDKSTTDATKTQEILEDDKADIPVKKNKEKKKTKEKSEGFVPVANDKDDIAEKASKKDKKKKNKEGNEVTDSKGKKSEGVVPAISEGVVPEKKTEKSEGAVPVANDKDDIAEKASKKDKKRKNKEGNEVTDSKDAKKRKRLASDENANLGSDGDGVGTEESKRRKTESLGQSKAVAEQGKSDVICTDNGHAENGHQGVKSVEANSKGNNQDELNNSAKQKSSKKEHNGSAEPKTVNAFQRVKVEQVEFKDDRLKDNSYWAKDGADIGYGAKAQEILGQVKGRGFRHEKTKKKRGSYRGGQIDLESHSVKFNYSDEE